MPRIGESGDLLKCSFCGKSQKQVRKLIAGPMVYISDECSPKCLGSAVSGFSGCCSDGVARTYGGR